MQWQHRQCLCLRGPLYSADNSQIPPTSNFAPWRSSQLRFFVRIWMEPTSVPRSRRARLAALTQSTTSQPNLETSAVNSTSTDVAALSIDPQRQQQLPELPIPPDPLVSPEPISSTPELTDQQQQQPGRSGQRKVRRSRPATASEQQELPPPPSELQQQLPQQQQQQQQQRPQTQSRAPPVFVVPGAAQEAVSRVLCERMT